MRKQLKVKGVNYNNFGKVKLDVKLNDILPNKRNYWVSEFFGKSRPLYIINRQHIST